MSDQLRTMLQDLAQDAPTSLDRSPAGAAPSRRVRVLALAAAVVVLGGVLTAVVHQDGTPSADRLVQDTGALPSQILVRDTTRSVAAFDSSTGSLMTTLATVEEGDSVGMLGRLGEDALFVTGAGQCGRSLQSVPLSGGPSRTLLREDSLIVTVMSSRDTGVVGYARSECGDVGVQQMGLTVQDHGVERRLDLPLGTYTGSVAYDRSEAGGNLAMTLVENDPAGTSTDSLLVLPVGATSLEAGTRFPAGAGCTWFQVTAGARHGEVVATRQCGERGATWDVLTFDTSTGATSLLAQFTRADGLGLVDLDDSGRHLLVNLSPPPPRCDACPVAGYPADPNPVVSSLDVSTEQVGELSVTRVIGARGSALWG